MNKIRRSLATIALAATLLSGSILLPFLGVGSMANAASSQHASASSVVGKSTQAATYIPRGWCPTQGIAC